MRWMRSPTAVAAACLLLTLPLHTDAHREPPRGKPTGKVDAARRSYERAPNGGIACLGNDSFACHDGRCIPASWRCDGDLDCKNGEDEDNSYCAASSCNADEFQCGKKSPLRGGSTTPTSMPCIPKRWMCDGEFDCEDRSDENNCPDVKCSEDQFACSELDGNFKLCIPNTWRCDGQKDCASGADEEQCEEKKCDANEFRCDSGTCIFANWQCDGEDDCGDKSDERNCTETVEEMCEHKHMFKCASGEGCIPRDWLCDGEMDCMDRSDERNCTAKPSSQCKATEFACRTGRHCVNKLWVCDGEADCPDESDEQGCNERECVKGEKSCGFNICISDKMWCNGEEDCADGRDEANCTAEAVPVRECDARTEYTCPSKQCVRLDQLCSDKKYNCGDDSGVCGKDIHVCSLKTDDCKCRPSYVKDKTVCACAEGFEYEKKDGTCKDIDECSEKGACDQICHNNRGGFTCDCYPGYKLSVGNNSQVPNKCRALGGDPLVLLSNRASIRQFDMVTRDSLPLIQTPGSAVAMDFHLENRSLIWSDIQTQKIVMCAIGNDSVHSHLAPMDKCAESDQITLVGDGSDVHTPDGLAIDWIHNLLFWTDGGLDQINVMDLTTRKRRTLFTDSLEEPRAIAVDPEMGLIFWSDWGKEARIERAGMDGNHRQVIVRNDSLVKWPNGLALDLLEKRVYWADAKLKSIFSSDYWGGDVRTVLHSHAYLRHPFSLSVFEDRVYYTDWEHDGVITVNKFTGGDLRRVMDRVTTPMTVRIYHKQAQPQHANKCAYAACSDMCLPVAVLRSTSFDKESKTYDGVPYNCLCGGTSASEIAACVAGVTSDLMGTGGGFSLSSLLFLAVLAAMSVAGFVLYRNRTRGGRFTELNFDNPVYRRTVEADMEDPFRDPFRDETLAPSQLVLGNVAEEGDESTTVVEPMDRPLVT